MSLNEPIHKSDRCIDNGALNGDAKVDQTAESCLVVAEQKVACIITVGTIMAQIISYIPCLESIAAMLVAMGKFGRLAEPCITELALDTLACPKQLQKMLNVFCNLNEFFYRVKPNDSKNLCHKQCAQNAVVFSPHLKSFKVNLQFPFQNTFGNHSFCYPNLEILHFDMTSCESVPTYDFAQMIELLAKNCPLLRELSMLIELNFFEHGANKRYCSIDFGKFDHLSRLSFYQATDNFSELIIPWPYPVVLPTTLEYFCTEAVILNKVSLDVPIASLKEILIRVNYNGGNSCRIPLYKLAPNLESLVSNSGISFANNRYESSYLAVAGIQLYELADTPTEMRYDIMKQLPMLRCISGDFLRNKKFWNGIHRAISEGRVLNITGACHTVFVNFNDSHRFVLPPFKTFFFASDADIVDVPQLSLMNAERITIQSCLSSSVWSRLVQYVPSLTRLSIEKLDATKLCQDGPVHFGALKSLQTLVVRTTSAHRYTWESVEMHVSLLQNLPATLRSLQFDASIEFPPLDPALQIIGKNCIHLPSFVQQLPNLESLCLGLPTCGIGEIEMQMVNLNQLKMLEVIEIRASSNKLESIFLQNLECLKKCNRLKIELKIFQSLCSSDGSHALDAVSPCFTQLSTLNNNDVVGTWSYDQELQHVEHLSGKHFYLIHSLVKTATKQ